MEASPDPGGASGHVKCKSTKYGSTDIYSSPLASYKSGDGGHPDDYDRRKQGHVRKRGNSIEHSTYSESVSEWAWVPNTASS